MTALWPRTCRSPFPSAGGASVAERGCRLPSLGVLVLAACAGPKGPGEPPAAAARATAEQVEQWLAAPGESAPMLASRSRIEVQVYRDGRLAHLGHNHVLEVVGLQGRLRRLATGAGVAQLVFRPERMRVDDAAARARAGEAFAQTPDPAAVTATRDNLLGERVLDAVNWPEVTLVARVANLAAPESAADLVVSLRGVSRRYKLPVSIQTDDDATRVAGRLRLSQSDFGITPFSVLGGALTVRDAVDVDFLIVAGNSGRSM